VKPRRSSFFRRRVPFVAQMEATECGAASLGMVLAHHGCHVPLAELRLACGVSRDGTSALDLVKAGKAYGLETKAFKTEPTGLFAVAKPAILHWELNHFVVLESIDARGADLVDPAVGRRRVSQDELSRAFTGVVLCPRPIAAFARRKKSGRTLAKYGVAARTALGPARVMIGSAVALEIVALVQPALTQVIIDFIVRPRQDRWLIPVAIVFGATLLLRSALMLARARILAGLGARADFELAVEFLKHLIALPAAFFAQRSVGELVSRMQVLLSVRASMTTIALGAFDGVLVAAYAALLLAYAPLLGSLVVALVFVRLAILLAFQSTITRHATSTQIAMGRAQSALVSAFSDPESHKAFGAHPLLFSRFVAERATELNASARGRHAAEGPSQLLAMVDGLSLAMIMLLGGRAVMHDQMTIGVLSSFVAVEALLRRPSLSLVSMILEFGKMPPQLDRIDDVLDTAVEPRGGVAPPPRAGADAVENV
jgi:ABC-type bacteriocin/lantibiotic exporter with double-glycine peptidase domain